jgi:hypothetical protein
VTKPDRISQQLWEQLTEDQQGVVLELVGRDSPAGHWFDLVGHRWADREWLTYLKIICPGGKGFESR